MRSQDTTDVRPIAFPFWMVREIALDLEEKKRLEEVEKVNVLMIANLKEQKKTISEQSLMKSEQISLLQKSYKILEAQYEAEKKKKGEKNFFVWILAVIAAGGAGFIAGSL